MTNDIIIKFSEVHNTDFKQCMRIDFKKRDAIFGFIIAANDYDYLMSKNLWRIVLQPNIDKWIQTHNLDLAKIFNGSDIVKLSLVDKRKAA